MSKKAASGTNDDADDRDDIEDDDDIDTNIGGGKGAGRDDNDPDDDDDDDDEGDGDDDKAKGKTKAVSDDDWEPPTKAEFLKMQRKLKKANTQSEKRRAELNAVKEAQNKAANDGEGGPTEEQLEAYRSEGRNDAEAAWKPRVIRQAAKAGFLQAGFRGDPKKLVRLLDMKDIDIEVDDDGEMEIDGLEEQILEIAAEFPEMFGTKDAGDSDERRKEATAAKVKAKAVDAGDKSRKPAKETPNTAGTIADLLRSGSSAS